MAWTKPSIVAGTTRLTKALLDQYGTGAEQAHAAAAAAQTDATDAKSLAAAAATNADLTALAARVAALENPGGV